MNKPPLQKSSASPPTLLPQSVRHRIFLYLGILITLLAFGAPHGGLIEIPVSFLLKNKLHLGPHELANFRLLSSIPVDLAPARVPDLS